MFEPFSFVAGAWLGVLVMMAASFVPRRSSGYQPRKGVGKPSRPPNQGSGGSDPRGN